MLKKIIHIIFTVLFLFSMPLSFLKTGEHVSKSKYVKNHFIVKFKNDVNAAAGNTASLSPVSSLVSIANSIGIKLTSAKQLFPENQNGNRFLYYKYALHTYYVVSFEGNNDVYEICKEYEKNKSIDFSEPDFIGEAAGEKMSLKPNDEFFGRQWGLTNDGSIRTTTGRTGRLGADMNVIKGWEIEEGSNDVIVAILDSGSKLDHPDLDGRFWINPKETRNGRDDDGNGYIDDINGWNFAYENVNVKDDGGHGTNISGTIGANTNNSIGYAGIDKNCKLMICKNLDDENLGEYSWWSSSLYYAASNGAKVINMSEGGFDYSKTLENAINYAYESGCLIVASMMNKNNDDSYYPASFKNVLAVGATDTDDGRCRQFTWGGGSNWGNHISVVAPGNRIYGLDYKDSYNFDVYWSGTSQATAYVTGIAALLLAQDNSRTNKDLKEIITSTAKDQVGDTREDEPGWDPYYGYGRVDLYAALMFKINPVIKNEDKQKDDSQNEDRNYKSSGDKQAKAVDRDSSNENNDRNNDDKRARKVER